MKNDYIFQRRKKELENKKPMRVVEIYISLYIKTHVKSFLKAIYIKKKQSFL